MKIKQYNGFMSFSFTERALKHPINEISLRKSFLLIRMGDLKYPLRK